MTHKQRHFFDPKLLNKSQAGYLWRSTVRALESAGAEGRLPANIRLGDTSVQVAALFDTDGCLVRFWLRSILGNRLAIVGNRHGLLPLDVESIHVR